MDSRKILIYVTAFLTVTSIVFISFSTKIKDALANETDEAGYFIEEITDGEDTTEDEAVYESDESESSPNENIDGNPDENTDVDGNSEDIDVNQENPNPEQSIQEQVNPEPIPEVVQDFEALARETFKEAFHGAQLPVFLDEGVWNDLVTVMMERRLYNESSFEELYYNISSDRGYAVELIKNVYARMLNEKYDTESGNVGSYYADYLGANVERVAENTSSNSNDLVPDYVKGIYREAKPVTEVIHEETFDAYRQYEVSAGIDVYGTQNVEQINNADIVLLIDNSGSMINNFDDVINSAKTLVSDVFPVGYNQNMENASNIAVVSFSGNSVINCQLTNDRNAILQTLDNISRPSGEDYNNTNIQEALFNAREILGMNDNSRNVSNSRNKIVVLYSDGFANRRSSDVWTFATDVFSNSTIDDGNRRWSFISDAGWYDYSPVAEMIYLPDGVSYLPLESNSGNNGGYEKQLEFTRNITNLESQFLAAQGVTVYSVVFSDADYLKETMRNMTYAISREPNFSVDKYTNPIDGYTVNQVGNNEFGYYGLSDLRETIKNSNEKVSSNTFKSYELTEKLNGNFEFAEDDVVISKSPYGEDAIDGSQFRINKNGGDLTVTLPSSLEEGTYFVNYKVKVKDDENLYVNGASKELFGEEAEDLAQLSEKSSVNFTKRNKEEVSLNFTQSEVSVAPNLQIDFTTDIDVVLAGEEVLITPTFKKGSGAYEYIIYEEVDGEKTLVEENKFFKAETNQPVSGGVKLNYKSEGTYKYVFEAKDLLSNKTESMELQIEVKEPKLNINIVDMSGGTSLEGAFETKISAVNEAGETSQYFLSGLGQRSYKYSDGTTFLKRGTAVSISSYVPYGYKIVNIKDSHGVTDGRVIFDLIENGGSYSGFEHEVTIEIGKIEETGYFFNWNWLMMRTLFNKKW